MRPGRVLVGGERGFAGRFHGAQHSAGAAGHPLCGLAHDVAVAAAPPDDVGQGVVVGGKIEVAADDVGDGLGFDLTPASVVVGGEAARLVQP